MNANKDKSKIQQMILKISMSNDVEQRPTVVAPKEKGGIGYEKAPTDDINKSTVNMTDDEQKLAKLESTISTLQSEIDKIMKMHTDDSGGQEGMHDWQSDDKSEAKHPYSMVHLILVFMASVALGAFLA